MVCIAPVNIQDPRESRGSLRLDVPCGKCGACRHNRRIEWSFRLKQELQHANAACWVTLTYADENLIYGAEGPTLYRPHTQLFMKRIRKNTGLKLRYYGVGEYGTTTQRPHYHVFLFGLPPHHYDAVARDWQLGNVSIFPVSEANIHYTTKYHVNIDKSVEGRQPEFAFMSRNPGIGNIYLEHATRWHMDNEYTHVQDNGFKLKMPRYYKEKIFTNPTHREVLADRAQYEMLVAYDFEVTRLRDLGIKDPHDYIQRSREYDAQRVLKKSKELDKL